MFHRNGASYVASSEFEFDMPYIFCFVESEYVARLSTNVDSLKGATNLSNRVDSYTVLDRPYDVLLFLANLKCWGAVAISNVKCELRVLPRLCAGIMSTFSLFSGPGVVHYTRQSPSRCPGMISVPSWMSHCISHWRISVLISSMRQTIVKEYGGLLFPRLPFLFSPLSSRRHAIVPTFDGVLMQEFVIEVPVAFSFACPVVLYFWGRTKRS